MIKMTKTTFMHLADAFIQTLIFTVLSGYTFFCMCVPWELNPEPFQLLTQCSTTEPQGHRCKTKSEIILYY